MINFVKRPSLLIPKPPFRIENVQAFARSVHERAWLRKSRWEFDRLPPHRRVRLEIDTDGRQLSFLLSAIQGAGYGVQLAHGQMLLRELLALRRHVPLSARVDSFDVGCAYMLTDRQEQFGQTVSIDYDVFSPGKSGQRMPYGMHPKIYYSGQHLQLNHLKSYSNHPRKVRVGFYGTHDPSFYQQNYNFPGLNRTQILEDFLGRYAHRFKSVPTSQGTPFAAAIDHRGGELQPKTFLSQRDYLSTLRDTSFLLSLPGWCMPLSHSLIEAMYCGAIPITNSHTFMHPPLRHGIEAITFQTLQDFHLAIEEVQSMSEEAILRMRYAVLRYYREHLEPISWWRRFIALGESSLLINAEELSVPLISKYQS